MASIDFLSPTSSGLRTIPVAREARRLLPDFSVAGFWRGAWQRIAERRLLVRLSRLDPHVMRDMGFDPELIAEALEGTWDEMDLARYLRRGSQAR